MKERKYIGVEEICQCGHKRKFHDEVIRAGSVKGSPYGAIAYTPYRKRYEHKCRRCDCQRFSHKK